MTAHGKQTGYTIFATRDLDLRPKVFQHAQDRTIQSFCWCETRNKVISIWYYQLVTAADDEQYATKCSIREKL